MVVSTGTLSVDALVSERHHPSLTQVHSCTTNLHTWSFECSACNGKREADEHVLNLKVCEVARAHKALPNWSRAGPP